MEIKKENNINYITGKHALNIHPDKCLTVGDWHEGVWTYIRMFPSEHITMGGECSNINTMGIWGEYGIYEGKKYIENMGIKTEMEKVYIANHKRAILDIVYICLKEAGMNLEVENASLKYLADKESINEMLEKSEMIKKYLKRNQLNEYNIWFENEKKALKGGIYKLMRAKIYSDINEPVELVLKSV
jgi:hypothetical protein